MVVSALLISFGIIGFGVVNYFDHRESRQLQQLKVEQDYLQYQREKAAEVISKSSKENQLKDCIDRANEWYADALDKLSQAEGVVVTEFMFEFISNERDKRKEDCKTFYK